MMQLLNNLILVKPIYTSGISEGGIITPDNYKEPSNKVIVVSVGKGTVKKPMHLKEGDVVYRVKFWGVEVFINGESHYLMDQGAILAKE